MILPIDGLILSRLSDLAEKLRTEPENLAPEVFRRGLVSFEKGLGRLGTVMVPERVREQILPQEKKPRGRKLGGKNNVVTLDEEAEKFIENNLGLSDHKILLRLGIKSSIGAIKKHRTILLEKELADTTLTDVELAKKFGLKASRVTRIRKTLKGSKKTGREDGGILLKLGDLDVIRTALRDGGKTLTDLISGFNLHVTRERVRQVLEPYGITGKAEQRTGSWYANKYGHPELADKTCLEKLLSEHNKSIAACAGVLGITKTKLASIIKHHGLNPKDYVLRNRKITELVCEGNCGLPLFRETRILRLELKKNPNKKFWHKKCWGKNVGKNFGWGTKDKEKKEG